MLTIFHDWRRKMGVLTLVFACVCMVSWVRSFNFSDYVQWNCGCCSANGNLYIVLPDSWEMSWNWPEWSVANVVAAEDEAMLNEMAWKWRIVGFGEGVFSIFGLSFRLILFPYWSIILPSTLLSAWLLFSKPRVAGSGPTQSQERPRQQK